MELNDNEIAFNNFINKEKINNNFDNQNYQYNANKFIITKLESINKNKQKINNILDF